MGWSFRESVKILPGVRLNFSRRGVSASLGGKGLHLGVGGGRAPRVTGGIGPLHYYQSLGPGRAGHPHASPVRHRRRRLLPTLAAVAALLGLMIVWMRLPPDWLAARWRTATQKLLAPTASGPEASKATTFLPTDSTRKQPNRPEAEPPARKGEPPSHSPAHGGGPRSEERR